MRSGHTRHESRTDDAATLILSGRRSRSSKRERSEVRDWWLIIADVVLGNWLGLYQLTWYDKALHFSSSSLVGVVGFLAIYVLHLTHGTRFHPWLDGLAILLVTLGIGTGFPSSAQLAPFRRASAADRGCDVLWHASQ